MQRQALRAERGAPVAHQPRQHEDQREEIAEEGDLDRWNAAIGHRAYGHVHDGKAERGAGHEQRAGDRRGYSGQTVERAGYGLASVHECGRD